VGAIVWYAGRVLLVQRNRPPGKGLWAIPGGRIRLGETLQEAAEREVFEETGIVIQAGLPVYSFDLIERDPAGAVVFHYVIVDVLAEYRKGRLTPGDDASDARWVTREEMAHLSMARETQQILGEVSLHRTKTKGNRM
jgi:ADP-ribose pyrophosphatase